MAFTPYRGKWKTVWLPVTTSTVLTKGAIVSFSSGLLIAATSSTTALSHAGIIKKSIASTDSDYATARKVPVSVPMEKNCEMKGDVTSGLVVGDIGAEIDLTDSLTVNRAATSIKVAMVKEVLSTTLGVFIPKFLGNY